MGIAHPSPAQLRASELALYFASFPQTVAVALGGSQSSGAADTESDIDLYVYTEADLPHDALRTMITQSDDGVRADLGLSYWGGVNMWIDAATGITVDCVNFGAAWMEAQITQVMERHQPSLGYSTCFCRTVQQSRVLYDPRGWFGMLQERTRQAYPEALRRNIIAHNHPVLRTIMSSYLNQVAYAVRRNDMVSINHRVAALLASYFDIVFALNHVLHPGEKRLLWFAQRECTQLPSAVDADLTAVLRSAGTAPDLLIVHLTRLLDRLDDQLKDAGLDPTAW